jgi:hypothetical protein
MEKQNPCPNCSEKEHKCSRTYEKLGKSKTSSVTLMVMTAFVLPLIIFAVITAAADNILDKSGFSETAKTAGSFILAVAAVFIYLLLVKVFRQKK